jgi:hypothetical protein
MLSAPFRVVLDACVLYPMHLRDVLLQAAAEGLYQAYWSKEILDEATRNLTPARDPAVINHVAHSRALSSRQWRVVAWVDSRCR